MSMGGSRPEAPGTRQRQSTLDRLWRQVEQLIEGSHLFRSLDDAGRRELLHRGRLVFFPAGSVILREGEPGESFFVIDDGVVEVSTRAGEAGEVGLTTLQRGAFFGEVAVLTGSPRTATVTALTDVSAVAFDRHDVDELLASNPKARRLLDAVMAGRARDAVEKIARASMRPAKNEQ
jgi:CRP-like cAMP-binding protein